MSTSAPQPPTTRAHQSSVRGSLVVILLLTCILGQLAIQPEARAEEPTPTATSDLVSGASCFIVSPVYGAFKLAFAGAGAIVGGFTWLFTGGDQEAAQRVWDTSLKGTYIITPEHLKGEKPVQFVGSTGQEHQGQDTSTPTPQRSK